MPQPGKAWRHVIINTYGTWLHGDPRGFRHRGHRIHSSGDYRNPPPPGEHAGLHRLNLARTGEPVRIPQSLRAAVGEALLTWLQGDGHTVLALSVLSNHAHLLVELPTSLEEVKRIVGRAKQHASWTLKDKIPGRLWSAGGDYRRIEDRQHHANVYRYILCDQGEGSWTWSFNQTRSSDSPQTPA